MPACLFFIIFTLKLWVPLFLYIGIFIVSPLLHVFSENKISIFYYTIIQ